MFAAISPSETSTLGNVRVKGGVGITVERRHGANCIASLNERDGYKVRFARRADPPEAIIINTGGGLVGGDRIAQSIRISDGAALTVTTQASERCYRANTGLETTVDVVAEIGRDATLAWLPQEAILFDDAHLSRTIDVSMTPSSRALIAETVVFGRRAMGETVTRGLFRDRWRIRRDNVLIFAENVRLDDKAFATMASPAVTTGAHVVFTLLLAAPDAEDFLPRARAVTAVHPASIAASAWNGKLVVRGIATKTGEIRNLMQSLIPALGCPPLPRVWWT